MVVTYRIAYSHSYNFHLAQWRLLQADCDGFPQLEWEQRASKAAHVEDAKFHWKPRGDETREIRGELLGPSLRAPSQGDCRILDRKSVV